MAANGIDEFQRQALEILKAQQQAYLDAVRAWKQAARTGGAMPPWPEPAQLHTLPTPTEVAEASAAFAARLLEEQARFMKQLSETLAATSSKR